MENTQVYAGYVVHVGFVEKGDSVSVGALAKTCVDYSRRSLIAPNHTMTHVLNFALRKVLTGDEAESKSTATIEVDQKGSLVDEDKLRFDFSWSGALKPQQLKRVEEIVNDIIKSEHPVYAEVVPLTEAKEITALRSVFGEKYPDPVRVISVGADVQALMADPKNDKWRGYSVEFCGGTHLTNTKQAELFVIAEETGIAKGIRRITAYTKRAAQMAKSYYRELSMALSKLEKLEASKELNEGAKALNLKVEQAQISVVDKADLKARLSNVQTTLKAWQKAQMALRLTAALEAATAAASAAKEAGRKASLVELPGVEASINKKVQEALKKGHPEGSFFVASYDADKGQVGLFPLVTKAHVKDGLSAKQWVDAVRTHLGGAGKGGGTDEAALGTIPGNPDLMVSVLAGATAYANDKGMM